MLKHHKLQSTQDFCYYTKAMTCKHQTNAPTTIALQLVAIILVLYQPISMRKRKIRKKSIRHLKSSNEKVR